MKNWEDIHAEILATPTLVKLKAFIKMERADDKRILPSGPDLFNAFKLTPFDKVRIVILGQDPYPDGAHAHGLAFSCKQPKVIPASLMNIFKEISRSLYPGQDLRETFKTGNLTHWAEQGILLINVVLTVEEGQPGSHQGKGWELFTTHIIKCLNNHPRPLVFMMFGKKAQEYIPLITDKKRHLILETSHPSPLSVDQGFAGSNVFEAADSFVRKNYFDLRKYIYGNNVFLQDLLAFGKTNGVNFDERKIKKMPIGMFLPDIKDEYPIDWTT